MQISFSNLNINFTIESISRNLLPHIIAGRKVSCQDEYDSENFSLSSYHVLEKNVSRVRYSGFLFNAQRAKTFISLLYSLITLSC